MLACLCCCCCGGVGGCGGVVGELYSGCEHLFCFVFLFFVFLFVFLGVWWMPWYLVLMKDVAACDSPWGVGERVLIRGFPNGVT